VNGEAQAVLAELSDVVQRILAAPGPHHGPTEEDVEELSDVLAKYVEKRFPGKFSCTDRREMARWVIVSQQAQRHAATVPVGGNLAVDALAESVVDRALEELKRDCWRDAPPAWSSAEDDELVSELFQAGASKTVVAALQELERRGQFDLMAIIQTYLELFEESDRRPQSWHTARSCGVNVGVVEDALLIFKNILVELVA
jgi:hypothetical protein